MKDKHRAVWEWLLTCPAIQELCFNFSAAKKGVTVLQPETAFADEWVPGMQFVDGSGEKTYTFTVVHFRELTTEANVEKNIDVLSDIAAVVKWIEEQEEQKNYPLFPEDCIINEISAIPSDYGVAAENETKARYMFSVQINYLFKKG